MASWLIKSEPSSYSWEMFVAEKRTYWDGVRNYQSRNNLAAMKRGDRCLFYHSVKEREIVGVARVVRPAYPDPTTDDDRWVVVDLVPVRRLPAPVSLARLKTDARTRHMAMVRQSRLSVSPVTDDEYAAVLAMAGVRQRSRPSPGRAVRP
ncbi:MAG: EVE domain-containing protein, partial [Acidobacteriota bacterium]